ncbi:efflux RND transporter permease subunit [Thioalkalivibrio sp. XN279]|uniref:efflux RND transporter permease subunit n=1 Tax=Thioalkalivibrio sp. XN279 TaxID=2714953 RepID=UPI00140B1592|nr:efflux RND transporter permease subunit [Thioalkalivibrio sp. XN279]NHA13583.1 efflux RND transporter permease subunit [Thioalkalivibrio sp. XN279]
MILTRGAIQRPVTTVMIFIALAVVGAIASRLLPLEKFPDIQFPGIFINVPYEGSTPEEVERLITRPVEEALATLSGVERMQSTSNQDGGQIFLQFGWDEDVASKGIEARAKVDAIRHQLPADVRRVLIFTGSLGDQAILNLRISSERDLSDAYTMLDRQLKRRIERVEGVSRVTLYGVDQREIRILLDANRVAAHGVDLNQLQQLLQRANFSVSAGRLTDGEQRYSVRPIGELSSVAEVKNILIRDNLRLGDIADIELRSPERLNARHLDRRYSIGLDIYKQPGANLVEVSRRVMREVNAAADNPQMKGISVFALGDQADGVTTSLSDLLSSGALGAVFAFGILYLFLRQAATTLIVVACVPFSILITLGVMYFLDISLNILSMMGLMLAIGMLVDNAVVVTESIFRQRQLDPDNPREATLRGVREVWLAVTAGTLTSIIVFVPILFGIKTNITVFLTHVAVSIVVAMLASLVMAQTVVPMVAARIPAPPLPSAGSWMTRLTGRYARALEWTLRHRWWTGLAAVLIVASVAIPLKQVKFDTFPQEAGRQLLLQYNVKEKYPLEQMKQAVDLIEEYLYANQEEFDIRSVYSFYEEGRAQSTLLLHDGDEARVPTGEIIERVMENLPEIVIGRPSFEFNAQGGDESFSLQLSGESTEVLARIAPEVVRLLGTIEGLTEVRADIGNGDREVRVRVDRERAVQLGLTPQSVASSVAVALRGQQLRDFRGRDGEIKVRIAFRENDRQSIEQLANLPLYTPDGGLVPLGSVAEFEVSRGYEQIRRIDRVTAVVINANLDGKSLDELRPAIKDLMDAYQLPPGYSWQFGRGFQQADQTQQVMMQNILLAIALIFLVMAALFESTVYPLSIITSIGFSIIGVFWFFMLTGTTFSFMATIGIMILVGVVVNNGIVLVDHVNNLRRAGLERDEALVQAGRDRLRPILMTVATTILGLLPLALSATKVGGDDVGAPAYFPMARAIIGGLGFSTVTSLLLVPWTYAIIDDAGRWVRRLRRSAASRAPATTEVAAPLRE